LKQAVQDNAQLRGSLAAPFLPLWIWLLFRRAMLAVYDFFRVGFVWRTLVGFAFLRLFQTNSALAAVIFQSLCCQRVLTGKSFGYFLQ
jgi:hypothetical protein